MTPDEYPTVYPAVTCTPMLMPTYLPTTTLVPTATLLPTMTVTCKPMAAMMKRVAPKKRKKA